MTAKQMIRDRFLETGLSPAQILRIEEDTSRAVGYLVVSRSDVLKNNALIAPEHFRDLDYWFDNYGTTETLPP